MVRPTDYYGILVIDKRESTIALLIGKKYEVLGHFTSNVAGKIKAGGQCVAEDSLVFSKNGVLKEIKEIKEGDVLSCVSKNPLKETSGKCVDTFSKNSDYCLRVQTKEPLQEIEVTPEHRLFVAGNNELLEEKFAEDLKEGDSVLLLKKMNFKGKKSSIIERKEAQLIGFITGDGYCEKKRSWRIRFYESEKQTANRYFKHSKQLFKNRAKMRWVAKKNYFETAIYGKDTVERLCARYPEAFEKTIFKSIPKEIQKRDNECLAAFLKGLFDAEGYVHSGRISLASASKQLVQEVGLSLLRFGIIASFASKHVKSNPKVLNPKPQWVAEISDPKSIIEFQNVIDFENKRKSKEVAGITRKGKKFERINQIPASGKFIRKLAGEIGLDTEDFETINTNFFRNERQIGFETFKERVIPVFKKKASKLKKQKGNQAKKAENIVKLLRQLASADVINVRIRKIEKIETKKKFYDLAVQEHENFVANNFFLHNSAHRFEQLRIEAEKEFFGRVSEKANQIFLQHESKLKGLIVAGPGITKNEFLERGMLDYRLKEKILGSIDTSYTDESGIREVMQKSDELLKGAEVTKERAIVNKFLEEISKDGLIAYGEKEVLEAIELGKAKTVMVSESLGWEVVKIECEACGNVEEFIIKDTLTFKPSDLKCSKCSSSKVEELEEIDYIDFIIEKARSTGAEVRVISTETPEGEQFLKSFGGLGAFLRYK